MPAIYPSFEETLDADGNFNGKSLSGRLIELDDIAVALGCVTLSELIDARTMALAVLEEDELPDNCPPVRWYSAQEGLTSIQRLLSYIEQHPDKLPKARAAILEDLKHLVLILEEAQIRNVRFHLLVDI